MGETVRMRTGNAEQVGYRTGLVAALDVGSSKVVCLIGRAEPGQLRVLGAALRESQGIKAGTVTSLDLAEESIRDAVAAAENHADARIQNVVIGINCGQPVNITSRNVMTLDGALVTDAHLRALLADGRA
jgi:cell division protein FtsA